MKTFYPNLIIDFLFIITNLFFAFGAFAQTATVTTDKDDYVQVSMLLPEPVGKLVKRLVFISMKPKPATCLLSHDITTVADANGNIDNRQF
jgi:hypothetical protein